MRTITKEVKTIDEFTKEQQEKIIKLNDLEDIIVSSNYWHDDILEQLQEDCAKLGLTFCTKDIGFDTQGYSRGVSVPFKDLDFTYTTTAGKECIVDIDDNGHKTSFTSYSGAVGCDIFNDDDDETNDDGDRVCFSEVDEKKIWGKLEKAQDLFLRCLNDLSTEWDDATGVDAIIEYLLNNEYEFFADDYRIV